MTLSRQNAVLSQAINVSDNAIGDTIFIPSGNVVNLSGILTVTSGNFSSGLKVNNHNVWHSGNLSNPVIGSGTNGFLPRWSSTNGLTNSIVYDNELYVQFGQSGSLISYDWAGGELGLLTNDQQSIAIKYQDGSFRYGGGGVGSENIVVASGGNVGIGTDAPGEKLDVVGNIKTGDLVLGYNAAFDQYGLTNNNGGGAPLWIISDLASMNLYSSSGITLDGDVSTVLQPNTGNVGIGNSSPSSKLDVTGDVKISGNLTLNNTSLSESQLVNIINGGNLYLWSNFR